MKYRAEVDGLRTVAVLPVILFHAGVSLFSGGYVGVDVFFVISGYLITGILAAELAEGRFSILRFYERRARRILPALFAVMLACLPFAWFWMLPFDALNFSRSLVAVSAFASNILFYMQAGYFAPNAEELPLLHTWSLAVEEQYYIVFPLLLWGLWRLGRRAVWGVLGGISLLSLALCHLLITSQPDATFYLIHTRAWELLAGSLVALWQLRNGARVQNRSEIGAAFGLAMILYGIFMFDEHTPFPSLWALVPVGGTALVLLFAAQGTLAARLLSLRVMVGIGLISYSAYLIHQPLLAFARIRSITAPDPVLLLAMAALTMPLAWLSWRFIERPFRQPGALSRNAIFAGSIVGLSLFIAIGLMGHLTRGLPERLPEQVIALSPAALHKEPTSCFSSGAAVLPKCRSEGAPLVAVIGDSHNDALAGALHGALKDVGFGVYERSFSGCWPIPGFVRRTGPRVKCNVHAQAVLDYLTREKADVLVLSGRWTNGVMGGRFDNGDGGIEPEGGPPAAREPLERDGVFRADDDPTRRADVLAALSTNLLDILMDHTVVLVYPVPEAGWHVPKVAAKAALFQQDNRDFSTSEALYQARNGPVIAAFDAIEHPNLYRLRPAQILCNRNSDGRCATILDGQPLYRDSDHLSQVGAALLSRDIVDLISTIPMEPES